ncbi:MAG: universal stress protein, partial [Fibrella sp.]|nr:universal stress protein [Armatimonadota bacterium]
MKILLATDGSEGASDAVRFLAGFDHSRKIHIHILTIQQESAEESRSEEKAEEIFVSTREHLGDFPGHVTTGSTQMRCSTSGIVERIQVAAEMLPADLVVTGSRGQSRIARFFLGSVALGVARHCPCSVLLGRTPEGPLDRVVVGIDDSGDALDVIHFLNRLPLPGDCAIHLVYVAMSGDVVARNSARLPASLSHELSTIIHENQAKGRERLDEAAAELRSVGRTVTTELRHGDAVTELLGVVHGNAGGQGRGTDLLVVGAR